MNNSAGRPVPTGKLLGGLPALNDADGAATTTSISTWASTKAQAATLLGLKLVDTDVTNIPMLATDPYGNFLPGPARGLPQYVTTGGLVEGDTTNPVPVPANVLHFDTPFLTDIAHNADPSEVDTNNDGIADTFPTPDTDTVASADFAAQPPGTYDNEMLDAHFTCGDGRCNENIALSTIHQIFHSEHDRLIDDIKNTLTNDTSPSGVAALAEWKSALGTPDGWNGSRLFQAARFVTEMEYQHLVFEEFGRKVQPAIRPFHVYSPDINPAIEAEFAHAVYRFGHSMLDDTVARTNVAANGTKSDNSLPLLTAFLNPPEYFNSHDAGIGTLTPEAAAGSIVMGSVDQVGNELDEFVTETLRNNLLGLPLDLPTLNMTRARDAGVPPLNEVRRQIHAQTNDGQLAPYTSWSDFGQNIKHPESLINFVAAYGKHPSIVGATTLAAKRDAARAIVDPRPGDATVTPVIPADVPPADAGDFMFGTGAWASSANGVTTTGVDDIDLWVGGLAEITNLFGGLLGSTFNYVFQTQLEKLQDGDRLYYLNRTPGMNLRSQLEGNSFAEMIERNTTGTTTLKADVFATADCKFTIGNQVSPAPAGSTITGAGSIADDPATDCDENKLLLNNNGTIQYRQVNKVDPVGINGQSVYQGDAGPNKVDKIWGGNDNDTFWGGLSNDVIEGNGGDDVALGGEGNDIVTDLSGADVEKGGPGNDALDGGIGDDIFMGGDGQDFINGGANDNEAFAGPGNDFVIAGQGADAVLGDGGDDWIQGGSGQDLLIGDHSAPFFDDPAQVAPGNDVFVGQVGENDYDAEGGDDLMAQNAAVDRNAGAAGFDWAIHQYDTVGADDDMEINNNLVGVPIQVVVNRDRWQETEADSGSAFNDVIKGTSVAPATIGGAGFTGCDALDQAGVARIKGLDALVTSFPSPLAPIVANSAAGACPLDATNTGGNVWGEGDILLGGLGSDTITGRGANDIIDGDRYVKVRISVVVDDDGSSTTPPVEIGSTDLMEHAALSGTFGPGTNATMTLQDAVFKGLVDPGNLVINREIVTPTATDLAGTANLDTAVFAGPASNYTIEAGATAGTVIVTQTGANVVGQKISDGVDTVSNIERLQFGGATGTEFVAVAPPTAAPTIGNAVGAAGSATVQFTWPTSSASLIGFAVQAVQVDATGAAVPGVTPVKGRPITDGGAVSGTVDNLASDGTRYRLQVAAINAFGTGPFSALSNTVIPLDPPVATAPGAPTILSVTSAAGSATVNFQAGSDGGSTITGFSVQPLVGGVASGAARPAGATATSLEITSLTNGTTYTFTVTATNAKGTGPASAQSDPVTPITTPGAPTIGAVSRANVSATVNWTAPASNGGSAITSYFVQPFAAGVAFGSPQLAAAGDTSLLVTGLANGTAYTFQVSANNAAGTGSPSASSAAVTPATIPGTPAIGTPAAGNAQATVTWAAPADNGGSAITGYSVRVVNAATQAPVGALRPAGANATSLVVTGLANGTTYQAQVRANNAVGNGGFSALSITFRPVGTPGTPTIGTAVRGNTSATVNWAAPGTNGGSPIIRYEVRVVNAAGTQVGAVRAAGATATSLLVTGLVNGTTYRFQVRAVNAVGVGAFSGLSNAVTPATVPGAPVIGTAVAGVAGGTVTATANWAAPASTGGSAITGYRVTALRMSAAGAVLATTVSAVQGPAVRTLAMTLPVAGNYRFTVVAINAVGSSVASVRSNLVAGR